MWSFKTTKKNFIKNVIINEFFFTKTIQFAY
jgi:hypothetical protein